MGDVRLVTEAEALAAIRTMHQRDCDAYPAHKAMCERFEAWCRLHHPTLSMDYCQGSTMMKDNFFLQDQVTHG